MICLKPIMAIPTKRSRREAMIKSGSIGSTYTTAVFSDEMAMLVLEIAFTIIHLVPLIGGCTSSIALSVTLPMVRPMVETRVNYEPTYTTIYRYDTSSRFPASCLLSKRQLYVCPTRSLLEGEKQSRRPRKQIQRSQSIV